MDPLQELLAKQEIVEAHLRYCRGTDRMDRELFLSVWSPDGTVDFSPYFTGTAVELADWAWAAHAGFWRHSHQCHGVLIEFHGEDAAVSEAQYTVVLRRRPEAGRVVDSISRNRYLDSWSRRDGAWKLEHRRLMVDISTTVEHTLSPEADGSAFPSARDPSDPSYALFAARRPGPVDSAGSPA